MRTIRKTKIVTKIEELIATRQSAGSEAAQTVCPFYQNPLSPPTPHAQSSAVLETENG